MLYRVTCYVPECGGVSYSSEQVCPACGEDVNIDVVVVKSASGKSWCASKVGKRNIVQPVKKKRSRGSDY